MEYELIERFRNYDRGGDARIILDLRRLKERITVDENDYPEDEDQALYIPEEEHA